MYGTNPLTMECVYTTPCGLCVKYDKPCNKKQGNHTKKENTHVLSTKLVSLIYDACCDRIHTDKANIQEYIKDCLEKECPEVKSWKGDD